jgi:hypothetical protein
MSAHEEKILDAMLQVYKTVKRGSEASEPTLSIQNEISALQGPDKLTV